MKKDLAAYSITGVIILAAAIAGAFMISRASACRNFQEGAVTVNTANIQVAVADTDAAQRRGLGGCRSLPPASGMYFTYSSPADITIWMRGMLIPIDIIWIADNKVIGIEPNVQPPENTKTDLLEEYKPPRPVTAVLEIKAGGAKEHNIQVGDSVAFSPQ